MYISAASHDLVYNLFNSDSWLKEASCINSFVQHLADCLLGEVQGFTNMALTSVIVLNFILSDCNETIMGH